jgi:hypothetical protein
MPEAGGCVKRCDILGCWRGAGSVCARRILTAYGWGAAPDPEVFLDQRREGQNLEGQNLAGQNLAGMSRGDTSHRGRAAGGGATTCEARALLAGQNELARCEGAWCELARFLPRRVFRRRRRRGLLCYGQSSGLAAMRRGVSDGGAIRGIRLRLLRFSGVRGSR